MKNVVSALATLVLLTLASVSTAFGQMAPPEPGAVQIGTFRAPFGGSKTEPNLTGSTTDVSGGSISTIVFLTESGETVYALDVNTVEFNQPCGWARNMNTEALVDMMAKGAIRAGVQMGFTPVGGNCENNIVDVYYPTCIARFDNGCPTMAAQPGSDYSINGYRVCGDIVNPMITLVYVIRGASICDGDATNASNFDTKHSLTDLNMASNKGAARKALKDGVDLIATR